MYSFLVLGQVPGTNFQITFQVWLYMLSLAVVVYALLKLWRGRRAAPKIELGKLALTASEYASQLRLRV